MKIFKKSLLILIKFQIQYFLLQYTRENISIYSLSYYRKILYLLIIISLFHSLIKLLNFSTIFELYIFQCDRIIKPENPKLKTLIQILI